MTVNAALGPADSSPTPPRAGTAGVKDLSAGHATPEAAVDAINRLMTF